MSSQAENTVSVFGSNEPAEGEPAYETARAVGRTLASLGYRLANGGYGGTMEASARGARETGGRTIGVICSIWRGAANHYVDEVIETDSLAQRVSKLIELGLSGYVVLPGATGTLVELATVWETMSKGLLDRRPLVCVGDFWKPLIKIMRLARAGSAELIAAAASPQELPRHFPGRQTT